MNIDESRIKQLLMEISKNTAELELLIKKNDLTPDSLPLKAAKYILIEIAEGISHTLQHLLAKSKGISVSGYVDTIVKGHQHDIISKHMFNQLKPFMDFRNSLVHRYWTIDDTLLIQNILEGYKDFLKFVEEIERYLSCMK